MARVRIALLGAGLIGREHAKLIERHPGATLAAIVDVTPAGEAYAREHGVAFHSDYERMLDDVRPDGAIVAVTLERAGGVAKPTTTPLFRTGSV